MQTCRKCGIEQPLDCYQMNGDPKQPGRLVRSKTCKTCRAGKTTTVNAETGELRCSVCREWKRPEEFKMAPAARQKRPATIERQGRGYLCRLCHCASTKRWNERNSERRVETERKRRRALGLIWRGSGRPQARRRYIPKAGDYVYIREVEPPLKGHIVAEPDPVAYTAKIKTPYGVDEYRWTDFVLYESLFNKPSRQKGASA
jgi:hypothetical protein